MLTYMHVDTWSENKVGLSYLTYQSQAL